MKKEALATAEWVLPVRPSALTGPVSGFLVAGQGRPEARSLQTASG